MLYEALKIYLCAISLAAIIVCCYDKIAAKHATRHRIRESTLLWFSVFGGSLAMLLTMYLIRHKTKHFGMITFISVFALLWLSAAIAYLLFLR